MYTELRKNDVDLQHKSCGYHYKSTAKFIRCLEIKITSAVSSLFQSFYDVFLLITHKTSNTKTINTKDDMETERMHTSIDSGVTIVP